MPGEQKALVWETENLELATFSKQAHNEECSQQVWWSLDKNFIYFFKKVTYFLDLLYWEICLQIQGQGS